MFLRTSTERHRVLSVHNLDTTYASNQRRRASGDRCRTKLFACFIAFLIIIVLSADVKAVAATPQAKLSTTSVTFGNQAVGTTSSSHTVTVTNVGTGKLTVSSFSVSPSQFVVSGPASTSLAPGYSAKYSITFKPTTTSSYSGTLTFKTNSTTSAPAVKLSGTGVAPLGSTTPTALSFGSQTVGTTSALQTVTLRNTGTATLTLSGVSITPSQFTLVAPSTTSIAPGASVTYNVTFTPTAATTYSGSLMFSTNSLQAVPPVGLSGTGVTASATAAVSPTTLTFASQTAGTKSASQTVILSNSGSGTLTVSGVSTSSSQFVVSGPTSTTIAPGASASYGVTFAPTASGSYTGALSFTTNSATAVPQVAVSGTATTATSSTAPSFTPSFFRNAYCFCGGYLGTYQYDGVNHYERFDATTEPAYWSGGFINAHGYSYDVLAPLKTANPSIKTLLYKDVLFTNDTSPTGTTGMDRRVATGVSYWEAINNNHRDWFLTTNGQPLAADESNAIRSKDYSGYILMDFGNVDYQNQFAANVIAQAQRDGWDGIFLDDVLVSNSSASGCGTDTSAPCTETHGLYTAKYPTRLAWENAMTSFLTNVGKQIRSAMNQDGSKHLVVIGNVANQLSYSTWLAQLDGTMQEGWMRNTTSVIQSLSTTTVWRKQINEAAAAVAAGKYYQAMLPSNADPTHVGSATADTQAIQYGLASELLVNNGTISYGVSGASPKYYEAIWSSLYGNAKKLGAPLAAYQQVGTTTYLYQRNFQNGTVFVNADTVAHTITFNNTTQTLNSASGIILLK